MNRMCTIVLSLPAKFPFIKRVPPKSHERKSCLLEVQDGKNETKKIVTFCVQFNKEIWQTHSRPSTAIKKTIMSENFYILRTHTQCNFVNDRHEEREREEREREVVPVYVFCDILIIEQCVIWLGIFSSPP